ncbi:13497_t:CDS:2 [Cetraspora pellucida]|uniref:13497_t:CDS:1 n=1 Tax=Cetraspora pellucida TaxID=1433469 RepID=A0A9N9GZU7_9GLOM|nr:13497_t:CDS:2 [Cetraspora pellucida]
MTSNYDIDVGFVKNHVIIKENLRSIENNSDVQEIFPTATVDNTLKDNTQKVTQQGLKSGLDQLSIETLKMMCKGEGLSESGSKKELVERLVVRMISKVKERGIKNSSQGKDMCEEKLNSELDNMVHESRDNRRLDVNEENFGLQDPGKIFGKNSSGDNGEGLTSKEGWDIAAGINDPLDDDPMEAYF